MREKKADESTQVDRYLKLRKIHVAPKTSTSSKKAGTINVVHKTLAVPRFSAYPELIVSSSGCLHCTTVQVYVRGLGTAVDD